MPSAILPIWSGSGESATVAVFLAMRSPEDRAAASGESWGLAGEELSASLREVLKRRSPGLHISPFFPFGETIFF